MSLEFAPGWALANSGGPKPALLTRISTAIPRSARRPRLGKETLLVAPGCSGQQTEPGMDEVTVILIPGD